MTRRSFFILLVAMASTATPIGCGRADESGGDGSDRERITIGLVAKSQSNPVFQAAYAGAQAAARELGREYGVEVFIDWQTPPDEDPQRQAAAIEQLARSGAQGIAVSCSDANTVTPAIDKAVELGSHVVCFDSDAPRSGRFAFFGTDDVTCGRMVMSELAQAMDGRGTIAILAGNQAAPNLQARVEGVRAELAEHVDIRLVEDGVFYHPETPEQAAEAIHRAQSTHPEIGGWALVGGWPLFTRGALKWEPGEVKVVSVDALPAQLPYLTSGHVEVLLAQDCFGWGHRSVEILLEKIVRDREPEAGARIIDPLRPVRATDVDDVAREWASWLGEG